MAERRNVVVTGGSSGIGLAFTRLFYSEGANVLVVSLPEEELAEVDREFADTVPDHRVRTFQCDLARPGAAGEVVEEADRVFGRVDVLVNNAGFGLYGPHLSFEPERISRMLVLNNLTPTLLCRLFGERMKARGQGGILNVASTAAFQPIPYFGAYAATKAYVRYFTRALAFELQPYGVAVTCLYPGPTRSRFLSGAGFDGTPVGAEFNFAAMSPERVARVGYDALEKGRPHAVPGLRNKVHGGICRLLPERLVVELADRYMRRKVS
ncbi:MAG: SDR family NAD(P)-dependent oxidoreductase [Desulfatibacillaceae bacterium]